MKRVSLFLLMAVLVLASVYSAGRRDGAGASSSQTLNIAIFEGGWGRAFWDDVVAQFGAAHPGVTINMTIDPEIGNILAPQIAAGEWPDFVALGRGSHDGGVIDSVIKNQEILDITDFFEEEAPDRPGRKLKDVVVAGTLESAMCQPYRNGRVYFAPQTVGPMGLVYNKNLFETKGWKIPTTWDEFFALDEELKKSENYVTINGSRVKRSLYTYQGIYASYNESLLWPAIAAVAGEQRIRDIQSYKKGSFDNPEVRSVAQTFARFSTGDYLMEGTIGLNHTQSQADMMIGKALFIPNGTWMEGEMAEAPREAGFTFGIAAAPRLNANQKQYVQSSMDPFWIPKNAKNPALAKEFLKFLYSRASVISFAKNANGVIAVRDGREIAKDYLSSGVYGMYSVYDNAIFMLMGFDALPSNTRINVSARIFEDNIGLLFTGRITTAEYIKRVEDAFAEVQDDIARSN